MKRGSAATLLITLLLILCSLGVAAEVALDLAEEKHRSLWSIHPAAGEASFDSFERVPGNPIFTGSAPYEWPVNGFLLKDPVSGSLNVYVGLYARGYFGHPTKCLLLQSQNITGPWQNKGIVLEGDAKLFDGDGKKGGHTPDVTVWYDQGKYHMLYDWARNDLNDMGLAYASAAKPEGPFVRAPEPIIAQSKQKTYFGVFGCTYGGTLLKRKDDWLIVSATSVAPGNKGGTWAMVAMNSKAPEGPYSEPVVVLFPQSKVFFPAPLEFFPAFSHDGFAYVPATILANRNIQILFRVRLEDALKPEAWEVFQYGSLWHAEAVPHEAWGIWGQTFTGFVDNDGTFNVMFPSKNGADVGTINLARRSWNKPYKNGFVISASEGHSLSLYQRKLSTFKVEAQMRSNGPKSLIWNHHAALGTDRVWHAGGVPHAITLAGHTIFSLNPGGWSIRQIASDGAAKELAKGDSAKSRGLTADDVAIQQSADTLSIRVNGQPVWSGPVAPQAGCIGVFAQKGSVTYVDKFVVSPEGEPCSTFLLATDGITGAGFGDKGWTKETHGNYKFGFGYYSTQEQQTAKWNYVGKGFALWSPSSPHGGVCEIWLDGKKLGEVNQHTDAPQASARRFTKEDVPFGFHAVTIVRKSGAIICDSLETLP